MNPYVFRPILKEVLWGGAAICPFKSLPPDPRKIGESWEVSDVDGRPSIVADGPEEGVTLGELVRRHGADLVGGRVLERFGSRFPLLVKFIDARDDLSVQVHPDDNLAHARHADEFRRRVEERTIMEVLKRYEVRPGDVFFLPPGRVHAIGAGCFVAEIQQTSDVTYRIYDYDRVGTDGRKRELHVAEALEAIDYTFYADHRQPYTPRYDAVVKLIHCPYFTTHLLDLTTLPMTRDFARLDSFVIYLCMAGGVRLTDDLGHVRTIRRGQTVLLPATTRQVTLTPDADGAKLLETFIA